MSDGFEAPQREPHVDEIKAGPMRRFVSEIVDEILVVPVLLLWFLFPLLLLFWLVVMAWGQTPGKLLTGIVAVRPDGTPFKWGRMFVRELFRLVFWGITFGVGLVVDAGVAMLSDDGRSFTDRVAGSTIVRVSAQQS